MLTSGSLVLINIDEGCADLDPLRFIGIIISERAGLVCSIMPDNWRTEDARVWSLLLDGRVTSVPQKYITNIGGISNLPYAL